jgi:hypothetical protein
MRTSNRIANLKSIKFYKIVVELQVLTKLFVDHSFISSRERSHKIKEIYDIIYFNINLLYTHTEHDLMIRFIKRFYKKGQEILDSVDKKSNLKIYRKSIMRTIAYAKDYLKKRNKVVNLALYKIAKKTCDDVSNMVITYL